MEALLARQASVQDTLDTNECLGSRQSPGTGDGRVALSAGRHPGACSPVASAAASRCDRLLLKEPDILLLDRTHQPPGRGVRRVA